jgi:hypothetical protein
MNIEVARPNFGQTRIVEEPAPVLGADQARLAVDAFGLSANNVTYAVVGDMLSYWDFFPAASSLDETTWGRVPVWGFADVVESNAAGLEVGERLFGYLPMGDELIITVGEANEHTVADVSPHRRHLHTAYNTLRRTASDANWSASTEELQMLLFPLFFTSFTIDDFLLDHDDHGATRVVISSASAKTSIGVAFLTEARGLRTIGLTSPGNRAFTESLGVYDEVLTYDQVGELAHEPTCFVDVAGNPELTAAVHRHLGDALKHSMIVGDTHWDLESPLAPVELPGPRPEFLFAPTQIAKRTAEWGVEGLAGRVTEAWLRFVGWVPSWLTIEHRRGTAGVLETWAALLAGDIDPAVGYSCTLATKEES